MQNSTWQQGIEWLAAAAVDPRVCKREWDQGCGITLLEAGRFWDVLSVPDRLGLLALDRLWRDPVRLPGPTLVDCAAHRVGFFLPPDPVGGWGTECVTSAGGRGLPCRRRTGRRGSWSGSCRPMAAAPCTPPARWSRRFRQPAARSPCWRPTPWRNRSGVTARGSSPAEPAAGNDDSGYERGLFAVLFPFLGRFVVGGREWRRTSAHGP